MKAVTQRAVFVLALLTLLTMTSGLSAQTANQEMLSLSECIQIALKNNSSLKTSEYSDQAAEKDVLGSYQNILPSISASARKSKIESGASEYISEEPVGVDETTGKLVYEKITVTIPRSFRESSSASLTGNQTLFDGGIWWNNIRQAKADKRSAEYNLLSTRDNVILDVQTAYFDLVKQTKLLEVNQLAVQRSQGQLDRAEKMFELGASARLDVYRAKVNLGNDRISMLSQQNIVEQAKKKLNLAMGRDAMAPLVIQSDAKMEAVLPDVDELVQSALENQPLIQKGKEDVFSRELAVKMAKGMNFPRISVFANYDRSHDQTRKVFSNFDQNYRFVYGLNVSLNLFNGFSDYVNIQKAEISRRVTQENQEEYKRNLESNIQQSYSTYQSYLDVIEINKENLEAAREELRLAEERFQIGAGTSLDVREAQVNLTRAEQSLIAGQFNAMLLLAQIDNQIGMTSHKMIDEKN